MWELQQDKVKWNTPSAEPNSWQAFPEEPKSQQSGTPQSVRTRNGHSNKQATSQSATSFDNWGFGAESFTAVPAASSQRLKNGAQGSSSSQGIGQSKVADNQSSTQPAGWAGF